MFKLVGGVGRGFFKFFKKEKSPVAELCREDSQASFSKTTFYSWGEAKLRGAISYKSPAAVAAFTKFPSEILRCLRSKPFKSFKLRGYLRFG
jgi:hypothetical protein